MRTYTIGLPVSITVYDDGTVKAEIDLSEADDAPFEDSGSHYEHVNGAWVEVEPYDEDTLIADKERISEAVVQARVIVR